MGHSISSSDLHDKPKRSTRLSSTSGRRIHRQSIGDPSGTHYQQEMKTISQDHDSHDMPIQSTPSPLFSVVRPDNQDETSENHVQHVNRPVLDSTILLTQFDSSQTRCIIGNSAWDVKQLRDELLDGHWLALRIEGEVEKSQLF